MAIEDDLQDKLLKLGIVSDTLASAWGKGAQSAKARQLAEDLLTKKLQDKLKLDKESANQKAKEIIEAERQASREAKLSKDREAAAKQLASDFVNLTKSAISSGQALYTSDKAFSSVTPTLEMMGQVVKTVSSALSGLTSGIPILEGVTAGTNKIIGVGIDITTQVAKMQLENAQMFVDTYTKLSQAGLNFGGNMDDMVKAAGEGGMSLMNYQKFVLANTESLKNMGGTMDQAASRVMKMSKSALENNSRLLIEMGGYDAVAGALANFSGMLTKAGVNTVAIQGQMNATSSKYLESLKMIEAVTGQTAKEQQKEQEEAMKNVAFQRKVRELAAEDPAKAAAMQQTLSEVTATFGKSGADYYKELAATGRIISEQNLQYRAFGSGYAKTIDGMNANRIAFGKDTEGRLKANADTLKANKGAIDANLAATAGIDSLAYAVKDGMVPVIGQFNSDVLSGSEKRENYLNAATKAIADQRKSEGESSKGAIKGTVALNETQMKMDKMNQSQIGKMGDLVVTLNQLQVKLIETFGPKLSTAVNMFGTAIKNIAKELGIQAPTKISSAIDNELRDTGVEIDRTGAAIGVGAQRSAVGTTSLKAQSKYSKKGTVAFTKSNAADLGLKIASGGTVNEKDGTDPASIQAAALIQDLFGDHFGGFTSVGPRGKPEKGNSYHTTGQALDFVLKEEPTDEDGKALIEKIRKHLRANGLKDLEILDEYNHPSDRATGKHFHVAVDKLMAKGGITEGPSIAGEAGPEAVVPLPDGRSIPVNLDISEMVGKLEEMISVMKDQRDISERTFTAMQ
jgi:hypothetical protein